MLKEIKKMIKLFKSQSQASKVIIIIGLICLTNTILSIIFSNTFTSPTDVALRSVMSSIFGYILGEHCIPNNFGKNGIQILVASVVAFICLFTLIYINWMSISQSTCAAVEIRNLLLSSVGFLISRVRDENNA